MPTKAQDPNTNPTANGLSQFRQFIYDNYDKTHGIFSDETESAWERRFQGHISELRLTLPSNRTAPILDFACGDGLLLAVAQSLGYSDLTGVDLSEALLQTAAKRSSAKLNHADGLEFLKANPDGAFEAIIAFDIFEHLTRPELLEVGREIARTLKPGGRLILRVPNGASPFSGNLLWSDLTHERPFTKMSCAQLLRPLGFEHIEALEIGPVEVHGLKSGIQAALWHFFRAMTVLRIAAESGQLRGHILTVNLHIIAHKAAALESF